MTRFPFACAFLLSLAGCGNSGTASDASGALTDGGGGSPNADGPLIHGPLPPFPKTFLWGTATAP